MKTAKELIQAIEDCAEREGIEPKTVTKRAADYSGLYDRLREGKTVTLTVMEKILRYTERNKEGAAQ